MMTQLELILAAEAKLRDAENNLTACVQSIKEHKAKGGQVLNTEVIAMTQLQATIALAYAALAGIPVMD